MEGRTTKALPGQKRVRKYVQMVPNQTAYRRLARQGKLPKQLRSEMLATDQPPETYLEVLEMIGRYRYALVDHIKTVVEGAGRGIERRLQQLFHHGYLRRLVRLQRLRDGLDFGSTKMAYVLDTRGYQALVAHRPDVAGAIKWRKDHTRRSEIFLEHQLAVAGFRAALEVAVRGRAELDLVVWRQDDELRQGFRYEDVETGELVQASVRPDAFFVIEENGQQRPFFLEMDMGKMDHSVLLAKLQKYYGYLTSEPFHKQYEKLGPNLVRVLFVMKEAGKATRSWRRREGPDERYTRWDRIFLKRKGTLAQVKGRREEIRRRFWFAKADRYDLERPESLLAPIWRRRGMPDDDAHRLFIGKKV